MASAPADPEFKIFALNRFEWEKTIRSIVVPSNLRSVKLVSLMLATYADADGKNVRPGERRLVAACQLSERSVRDALKYLREEYLIFRHSRGSNLGARNYSDVYQLSRPSDWQARFKFVDEEFP